MKAKTIKTLFTRLASLAASIVIGIALLTFAGPASASSGSGWLRLAHLSPNTPAVDVYLYSFHNPKAIIVVHHVAYGTISGYEKVPSGQYTVAMRAAGAPSSSSPVISASVNVHTGDAYTVAGMGPAKGLRLVVLRDRLRTPPGKALVRIIQASLDQHEVTITAGSKTLVRALRFASVTSYKVVPAGTWEVKAAGETQQTQQSIQLSAGTIHTIVVLDDPGRLALDDLVDSAGSAVPVVAPATGFGGTAPKPAHFDLLWLMLIAGGLLMSAAGARWAIRSRGAHVLKGRRRHAVT